MGFDLDKWGLFGALLTCNLPEETVKAIEKEADEIFEFQEQVQRMSFYDRLVTAHRMGVWRVGDKLNTDIPPFKIPESLEYEATFHNHGRKWLMARYKEHLVDSQKTRPKAWDGLLPTILMKGGIECEEDQRSVLFGVITKYFELQGKKYYL